MGGDGGGDGDAVGDGGGEDCWDGELGGDAVRGEAGPGDGGGSEGGWSGCLETRPFVSTEGFLLSTSPSFLNTNFPSESSR